MRAHNDPWDLAGAVLDGKDVDWARAADARDRDVLRLVEPLRAVAAIAERCEGQGQPPGRREPDRRTRTWSIAIVLAAAAQSTLGVIAYVAGYSGGTSVPAAGSALVVAVFAAAAMWLFAGGARDRRAWSLGAYYLVVSASFARRFTGVASGTPFNVLVAGVYPDAFLPACLWSFASRFPRVNKFSGADRFCRAALRVSVVCGALLFAANLALTYLADTPAAHLLHRAHHSGFYWAIVLGLCAAALPMVALRARLAPPDERHRVAFFCGALVISLAPIVLETLAEIVVPDFARTMSRPEVRRGASWGVFACLLILPLATAYAVLVQRVLDVRVVIGRALQYLLARATLIALGAVPFALLLAYGIRHKEVAVGELFTGSRGGLVYGLALAGVLLLWARRPLLRKVDRVFFRESVDLTGELSQLTAQLRSARSSREVIEQLEEALERTMGVILARTYLADAGGRGFTPARGSGATLPFDSASAALLRADPSPVDVGPDHPRSLFSMLPADERHWVADSGYAVFVPLAGRDDLRGFVALSAKRSGLTMASTERSFLSAAATAAVFALEARHGVTSAATPEDTEPAGECGICGSLFALPRDTCSCGGPLRTAALPALLHGKFRVESRLGAGGMGIVYRGRDDTLRRPVALKTLSRLSRSAADRLAHEARVMASVTHPNLATIYAIERWRDTPILVVEFLEGGTLGERLARGPLPVDQVLRIGLLLAPALEQLHQAGVLHRDIKPTNIAFTGTDVPKLLDFGLASVMADAPLPDDTGALADSVRQTRTFEIPGGTLAGTPLYVSPEALCGAEPDQGFDLWALALVMYEAIAGCHPFAASTVPGVLANVRRARIPDIRQFRPDCSAGVAERLSRWLSADAARRPDTATRLREAIAAAMTTVA
jgi:hypothetical protein